MDAITRSEVVRGECMGRPTMLWGMVGEILGTIPTWWTGGDADGEHHGHWEHPFIT